MGYFGKKKGTYIIDWKKVRTYVCPEGLDDSKVSSPRLFTILYHVSGRC